MRITGGRLRGRTLDGPPGRAKGRGARGRAPSKGARAGASGGTRPTTDRVREALFSALASRVDLAGVRAADLFAGTGALGLEALSRGAAHALFVERHGPTLALARRNAAALGVEAECAFRRADALAVLGGPPLAVDLLLMDPPYAMDGLDRLPGLALPHLTAHGIAALEHDARHDFSAHPACAFARDYGSTRLSLFAARGA